MIHLEFTNVIILQVHAERFSASQVPVLGQAFHYNIKSQWYFVHFCCFPYPINLFV